MPKYLTTYRTVLTNELVFCLFDVEETPRTVGLAQEDGVVTGAYVVMHASSSEMLAGFIELAYLSRDRHKLFGSPYAGLRHTIRKHDFKTIGIPVPSMMKQSEIVEAVRTELDAIDRIQADVTRGIDLSRERRAALFTAAVTGQIDVTNTKPAVEQLEEELEAIK